MNKIFICTLLLSCLCMSSFAQQSVSGTVTNANDGLPLPNVSVTIRGTTNGTVTDSLGHFSMAVPAANTVLIFSFTGFTSAEINAGGRAQLQVSLHHESNMLNDVVVIGYGTARKSDLTGSVSTIKSEQIRQTRAQYHAGTGRKNRRRGRQRQQQCAGSRCQGPRSGYRSINSSLDPTYVVDGVIGVDPNTLNPNEIASLEVLKDASATAIFGARGANGVIIVTTKRGYRNKTIVSYDGNVKMVESDPASENPGFPAVR